MSQLDVRAVIGTPRRRERLRAMLAIWRGQAVMSGVHVEYGEVDFYGRAPAIITGRSHIHGSRITVHAGQEPPEVDAMIVLDLELQGTEVSPPGHNDGS